LPPQPLCTALLESGDAKPHVDEEEEEVMERKMKRMKMKMVRANSILQDSDHLGSLEHSKNLEMEISDAVNLQ